MNYKNNYFSSIMQRVFKVAFLWLYGIVLLFLFRLAMLIIYSDKITIENPNYKALFLTGFTFDTNVVMTFLLIPFILSFIPFISDKILSKIRYFFIMLFNVIAISLSIITITYFKEYNNQFDYNLFEGLYDDKVAILSTIIKEYNLFVNILVIIALIYITTKIINKIEKTNIYFSLFNNFKLPMKIATLLIIIILTVFALRGAMWFNKPAIKKWAYVTKDDFLNKIVINSIKSLKYAYNDYKKLHNISKRNPYVSKNNKIKVTKDELLHRVSSAKKLNVNHIVLVVMESYDSWPLQEKYEDLHITDELRAIAKKGVHFKNFLPASPNTMNSLGSIISGLPYMGVNISLLKGQGKAEITSVYEQFKALGYETYFFYGGLKSWQNIGNFVKTQGVENIYTSLDIQDKNAKNVWGVNDDKLFELVSKKIKKNKKTFSIIMTTTYHPPFTLDVYKYGYKYKTEKDYPKKYQKLYDGSLKPHILGHLWYADKALGKFVNEFQKKHPNTLFVFTGDHFGRRYFNSKPNLYESSSVPLILYGNNVEKIISNKRISASHMNIIPTIIELVAPKGFEYFSFEKPIQKLENNHLAIGYKRAMKDYNVYEIKSKKVIKTFDNNTTTIIDLNKQHNNDIKAIIKEYYVRMAKYWEATIKGIQ